MQILEAFGRVKRRFPKDTDVLTSQGGKKIPLNDQLIRMKQFSKKQPRKTNKHLTSSCHRKCAPEATNHYELVLVQLNCRIREALVE